MWEKGVFEERKGRWDGQRAGNGQDHARREGFSSMQDAMELTVSPDAKRWKWRARDSRRVFRLADQARTSHFLISEENELALFWYLSGEFVDQTRAGFRVVKSGVG